MRTLFAFVLIMLLSFDILTQTFTVGVENINYMPYYGISENGDYIGLAADILKTFADSENITFTFVP